MSSLLASTAAPRSPLALIWQDSLTVFWGDWLDLRVRITQIVSSGLVSPLIYIVAFGFGLGSSLRPGSGLPSGYNSYLEFILPGMVALSSMAISFGGTTFSICGERLFSKTFEETLLLPVHPLALHIGKMIAGVVRGLLTSVSLLAIAILATGSWGFLNPLFLLTLVLNCATFAGIGVLVGLRVKSLETVGLYNNFLIVPMSFLGATFFDPAQLPIVLKAAVYLMPLTYTNLGLRAAAYNPANYPWYSLLILVLLATSLAALGAKQFDSQQD